MDTTQLRLLALVAVGGALGSVLRYGLTGLLTKGDFPWGTFAVNLSGTFLLSMMFFSFLQGSYLTPEVRVLLFVGVFGGFTTFSTFGLETVNLFSEGQYLLAGANVVLNAGLCLGGAFAGRAVGLLLGGH